MSKFNYAAWMFIIMVSIMVGLLLMQEAKHDRAVKAIREEQPRCEASEAQAAMIVALVGILDDHGIQVVLVQEGGALEIAPVK